MVPPVGFVCLETRDSDAELRILGLSDGHFFRRHDVGDGVAHNIS